MTNPNGYETEPTWEYRGRKKKAPPPEPAPTSPPAAASPSVSAPSPAGGGEGIVLDTGTGSAPRYILGGFLAVFVIGLLVSLLLRPNSPATTPPSAQATAVPVVTTPAPVNTPIPTATAGERYIEMVEQLQSVRQDAAAASMAEKALKTVHLFPPERTRLQELALTAQLHALLAAPVSPLNVAEQQQVVNRYRKLEQLAVEAGVSFPTHLEGARLAKDAEKFLLSKTLFEEAYVVGEYTKADQDMLRLYKDVLYRMGWYFGQVDALKAEGLQLLAASHALSKEVGITHGPAWIELGKYCGTDETKWPKPAPTPLLDTGGSA